MGQKILILGESGSGKTSSLRNFASDEIKLIKVVSKNLPFRGTFDETVTTDSSTQIVDEIKNTKKKIIVLDDAQYIMSNEFFRRTKETGWDKFADIGFHFFNVLNVVDSLPEDTFVYFLAHTQVDSNGKESIKTIGKVLDEKLTIEGLFTIVLKSTCCDGVYNFQTQNSGRDTCKSPMGMFKNYLIDNDLKMVDSIIREYWGYEKTKMEEVGVAENAPSMKNPKPVLMKKAEKVTEAPVIKSSKKQKTEAKKVDETPVVEEVKEETTEQSEVVEEVKQVETKPAIEETKVEEVKEETKKPTLDDIKARLAAMKAAKNK